MKKIIFTLLILSVFKLDAQDLTYLSYRWNKYETPENKFQKPTLGQKGQLLRRLITVSGKDTIENYIDLERITYADRHLEYTYYDDGTLESQIMVKFLDNNETLTTELYKDEESFELDSIFRTYNQQNLKTACVTRGYEFDTLTYLNASHYAYHPNGRIDSIEHFNRAGERMRKVLYLYNQNERLDRIEYYNAQGKKLGRTEYHRNQWVKDKLYEVLYYDAQNQITQRIITPENPRYPANMIIEKRYAKPDTNSRFSVKTKEIIRTEPDSQDQGFMIEQLNYEDQTLLSKRQLIYDHQNRIIKDQYENVRSPGSIRLRIYHYTYNDFN